MLIKKHQNRFLLSKIIKQKGDLIMHFYSRYRNFNSFKKCRVIFIDNNYSKCVFFEKACDVFSFENAYKY